MKKYYLLPESDIKALEEERKKIHNLIEEYEERFKFIFPHVGLTTFSWKITHRRYKWLKWFKQT